MFSERQRKRRKLETAASDVARSRDDVPLVAEGGVADSNKNPAVEVASAVPLRRGTEECVSDDPNFRANNPVSASSAIINHPELIALTSPIGTSGQASKTELYSYIWPSHRNRPGSHSKHSSFGTPRQTRIIIIPECGTARSTTTCR